MGARSFRCGPSLVVMAALLAGCGGSLPLKFAPPAAGQPDAAASAPVAPSSATSASANSAAVKIGAKSVELSSVEFDATCARVVAPFELSDNLGELTKLGTSLLADSAGNYLGQQLQAASSGNSGAAKATPAPKLATLSPAVKRAALRMNWLPLSVEQRYGRHLLEQMQSDGKLLARDSRVGQRLYPKGDALLAEVLAGVTEPYAYQFELHISTEAGENAMALPGGYVVVDKALLEKSELRDKANFALAHEVGHVLQRHQTRALQARVIDALALKGSLTDLVKTLNGARNGEAQAVLGLLVGGKLVFEKHSETQELQADACGMRVLDQGKTSDGRLLAAVQAFARSLPPVKPAPLKPTDANAQSLEALALLVDVVQRPVDAHPNSQTRIAHLETMLTELRARPGLAPRPQASPKAPKPAKPQPLPTLKSGAS